MKRLLLWGLLLLVFGVPLAACGVALLVFEDVAAVARAADLTPEQVARAKRILDVHDPRKMPPGVLRTFTLAAEDLELAANFVLAQRGGSVKFMLQPGAMTFFASVQVPPNPFGRYVNVEGVGRETSTLPELDRLQIGRLPVPAWIANWTLARALAHLDTTDAGQAAADALHAVRFASHHIEVEYEWRADLPERLRNALLDPDSESRLRAYQEHLAAVTSNPQMARQVSMVSLLKPLMALAMTRSNTADPVAENRAAIIVLAFYVNGRGLAALVPAARNWPRPQKRGVTLSGRTDFAQHFAVSAALAATAGSPLSDAIGIYKEVGDSRGGSGFSFADIAADRAGTLFGERATRPAGAARALQRRVAADVVEADLMIDAADLPERLAEAEFKRRFEAVGSASYQAMTQEIERRLARLALYR